MPKDPRCSCEHPSSASTIPRFCHRGSPSDIRSPGAVSRFGLAPVHPHRLATRASLGVMSSFDFCNTTRSADSPRDSFVPRACAGRSQTRFLARLSPTSRLRAVPISCERAPAEGTEIEVDSFHGLLESRSVRSRAPTRRVPSTPWSQMRACEHWFARRFRTRRRPTLPTVPAKGRCAAMNRSAFHRQDRLTDGDRSPRVVRPASLFYWLSRGVPLGGPTPFFPFAKCRP